MLRVLGVLMKKASCEDTVFVGSVCGTTTSWQFVQTRGKRRTLTPPPWIPKKEERVFEQLDRETRELLQQVLEQEKSGYRPSWRQSEESPLREGLSRNVKTEGVEWNENSKRVGLLARKIGMLPQWLNDGTRVLCTMLEFPDNCVVSAIDPETWYRKSLVGKSKAFGIRGPMWKVTVGAVNADPSKFTRVYRNVFECQERYPFRTTKSHRRIGSIGSTGDARVWPGKRMPGHMGYEWVTTSGLEVLRINPTKQVMYIKGCVPGEIGEILLVKDCLQPLKRVKNPPFPTYYPTPPEASASKEDVTETEALRSPNAPVIAPDGEIFASNLFRFTSPSIVFTEEHETKAVERAEQQGPLSGERPFLASRLPRAISAARLPHGVLLSIFEYLTLRDLAACMRVCRHWWAVLEYQDSIVWERLAHRIVPEEAMNDPCLLSETPSYKEKIRAYFFAWNPNDSSKNNYLRPNGFTVHRNPVAQSTDGIRGKIGVSNGIHAWEFIWEGPLGTVACIGVGSKHAALHCQGYVALLGSDDQSWGWNLVDNQLMHNNAQISPYPRVNNPPKYQMGERIRMVMDCDRHTLYFERGTEFLGVAFNNLPPLKLFPAMCGVYGNTEVSMVSIVKIVSCWRFVHSFACLRFYPLPVVMNCA
ncbi:F-box/SPRY domain-containing protein 1 [Toxocara canis]|uniref:F-box/SPRY domain-containing protein 1 n=1 Tax=Toxocara canis TaxID=6265 RepID=A0A0B2VB06_TOXCA|nr:F-box/SPRY domain-containing protein 1 [Toxocara canis]